MKWKKLGLIFAPNNNYEWMVSHASNPVAQWIYEDIFRIYFSCRNKNKSSSIGFIDIDIINPSNILKISEQPLVQPGELGTFDDSGVSMGCFVTIDDKKYLYYLGWNLSVTVPWRNSLGLAISNSPGSSDHTFTKYSKAPIVDRNDVDPYSISYPWVIRNRGIEREIWKMWYGSNLSWGTEQKDMEHVIKYAESQDGIIWERKGIIAINFKSPEEYAMSKPCVIQENNMYKMWYSYRGQSYRIGYAESDDGIHWIRTDEKVGIDVSDSGWDSEMIEYPCVFDHKGERYMLYNGNGYGKTGFGLAILTDG
jgi:predicted GH43/DUF377 family glycosyl hydrolase